MGRLTAEKDGSDSLIKSYAGVGINLFDMTSVEVQLELLGIGTQVNIKNCSVGVSMNLIGGTSITIGREIDLGNGMIKTKGFTIGVNTSSLVLAICWVYKLITIGDFSPIPIPQPA